MVAECEAIEQRDKARQATRTGRAAQDEANALNSGPHGEVDYLPPTPVYTPIRLRIKGDELQTSRSAQLPFDHAVKAFRLIKRLHDKGQAYERNGHSVHLGHLSLTPSTPRRRNCGMSSLEWPEIERLATLAGVN